MSYKIVVLANAVIDMCIQISSFPIVPAQHQVTSERVFTPGALANTMICGARLDMHMIAMGNIGDDDLAEMWQSKLLAEGVDIELMLHHENEATTYAIVLSEPSGEHVFLGARPRPNSGPDQFPDNWKRSIANADALLLNGWNYRSMGPAPKLVANEIAHQNGVPMFFDPGPEIYLFSPEWQATMIKESTGLLLTYEEAEQMTGLGLPPAEMATALQKMGAELVILKLGGDGMIARTANDEVFQAGFAVDVVDLTAAGDCVAASVMHSWLAGHDLDKMVTLANATGAACVQKFGAGINVPYRHEIQAVLKNAGLTVDF